MGKWKCNQASNMFLHIQTPFFSSLYRLPLQPNAVKKIKSLLESYANTNFVRLASCEKWRYSIIYMGFTLLHLIYWKQAISHNVCVWAPRPRFSVHVFYFFFFLFSAFVDFGRQYLLLWTVYTLYIHCSHIKKY